MATLLTIPLELLVSISSFLPTSDLAALRLTCKQVERSLYEWFSDEFFTKKQFMLTHASLQALIDISKHVSFSKKLSHVIIATNTYDIFPMRFRDADAATRYIQGFEDQKALLVTGMVREMLTEAFQNLANLQTVGIRDFNAPSRVRDGDHASWSAWGATTVYRETGYELHFYLHDTSNGVDDLMARFSSSIFSILIHALGKANCTPLHLEVLLRKRGVSDAAFILPDFLRPTAEPMLHHLQTLMLNVDLDKRSYHTYSSGTPADPIPGRSLRCFLGSTPNLNHLRLNFHRNLINYNESFLEWLGQQTPPLGLQPAPHLEPAPIALRSLKRLDLGQLIIHPDVIVAVLTKFAPNLEGLSLWKVGFSAQSSVVHAMVPPSSGSRPNLWAGFFSKLARIPQLELKSLKVGMLQQDFVFVSFKAEDDEKAQGLKMMDYTGTEMHTFLKRLAEQVVVLWPEPVFGLVSQEAEDSDEDEEMADEGDHDSDEDDEDDD